MHPEESEEAVQVATLHYFETRPDILRATMRVLDERNPNLISGQEWLIKLDQLLLEGYEKAFSDMWEASQKKNAGGFKKSDMHNISRRLNRDGLALPFNSVDAVIIPPAEVVCRLVHRQDGLGKRLPPA